MQSELLVPVSSDTETQWKKSIDQTREEKWLSKTEQDGRFFLPRVTDESLTEWM